MGDFLQTVGGTILIVCCGGGLLLVVIFMAITRGFGRRGGETGSGFMGSPWGRPRDTQGSSGTERPTIDNPDIETSGGFGSPGRRASSDRDEGFSSRRRVDDDNIKSGSGFGGKD